MPAASSHARSELSTSQRARKTGLEALTSRTEQEKDEEGGRRNGTSLLSLTWHVIFYLPAFNSTSSQRPRYLFISFDAWEYVGSDPTWAGLVTTLLDEIEEKHKILFSVVRAFGGESVEGLVTCLGSPLSDSNPPGRTSVPYPYCYSGGPEKNVSSRLQESPGPAAPIAFFGAALYGRDQNTNEDIYCEALAETLHHIALPVMVGFYAPWGRNKRGLLGKIEEALTSRTEQETDEEGGRRNGTSLLSLIWHVIFYLPAFNSTSSQRPRYLFISFDAWEYVGSDHTWAGLVTTLLDEIEEKHKILFSVVRAFGGESVEGSVTQGKKWVPKRWTHLFLWGFSGICVGLTLCTVVLKELMENELWKSMGYMTLVVSAAVSGLPFILVAKNFHFTMKKKLQTDMDRKDLSAQLGFMHSVKEEVKTTVNFLRFMALKEDREVRVVLKITSLDLCAPDKVVAVLDAINILLCDPNAPFISILAADPSILVECIQWSSNTCSNGYLYLDRIVSLPFSLPQMSPTAKSRLLERILKNQPKEGSAINLSNFYHAESAKKNTGRALTRTEVEEIGDYLRNGDFDAYFPGNSVQMKRVVNTVLTTWTMIKMGFRPKGEHKTTGEGEKQIIEQLIDWVVLANCWPCRLSWILQCVEDDHQRRRLEGSQRQALRGSAGNAQGCSQGETSERNSRGLLHVYEAHAWELDRMKYSIRKLLELDGDPDLFRIFLQKSHFTVGHLRHFSDLLINLAFSLKRRFELLRGLNSITRANEDDHGPSSAEAE
ncbi:NTPase KAP family P-loop domain-containing protein 1-like [Paroedura picta]|uniref:NTPase KAP family P-loop domain-containing protein 1-like n=1 Tax=Paroedura picta TaxID=143630 RepID=UPI0040568F6D